MGVLQVFIGEEELVLECSHSALTGSVCHHDSAYALSKDLVFLVATSVLV